MKENFPFEILIADRQKKARLSKAKIRRWSRRILNAAGRQEATLSLVFVEDREMRALHQRYLGKNSPTDVLAFGQKGKLLGDVVISVETARRRAPEFGNRWDVELLLYLIHGILHLVGFRDSAPKEKRGMRGKEEEILNCLLGNSWRSKKLKPLF